MHTFLYRHYSISLNTSDINFIADQSLPGGVIPPIVVQCVAYLNRPMCLNEEGLFRIPGDMSQIRRLRDGFIAGIYK